MLRLGLFRCVFLVQHIFIRSFILKNSSLFLKDEKFPSIALLHDYISENQRFSKSAIPRCVQAFGPGWLEDFEAVLSTLFASKSLLSSAADGYGKFAMRSMRLQVEFEKNLAYKSKTYAEAAAEVYFNEKHMMEEYLPGLLLSHYLWLHHYRQLRFFETAFISSMAASDAQNFVEVGIGTGVYSSLALRQLKGIRGTGFDISPSSKQFAETQLNALGFCDRYQVILRDIVSDPLATKVDWLICVEVLEHLEDPLSFLVGLKRNLALGGKAFITAAVNAAHDDHIYLYRNADEVLDQLKEAGFTLEQSFVGTAYRPSGPNVPVPEAAAFIVC